MYETKRKESASNTSQPHTEHLPCSRFQTMSSAQARPVVPAMACVWIYAQVVLPTNLID